MLVQIATQVMLLDPTVTDVFFAVVTELQLHPEKENPDLENPPSDAVINVWPFVFEVSVGVVPDPPFRS